MSASAAASATLTTQETRVTTFEYNQNSEIPLRATCSLVLLSGKISHEVEAARDCMRTIAEMIGSSAATLAHELKKTDRSIVIENENFRVTCTFTVERIKGDCDLQTAVEAIGQNILPNLSELFS